MRKTKEMFDATNKKNFESDWNEEDFYVPSIEEYYASIEDAEEINRNMMLYGTIDKPKES